MPLDLIIVGAGFGGLGMGIAAARAGHDFVIVDKGDSPGGTWRDNTYPGAACDVESHLYSFSFAPKADWSRKYAPQAEIRAYIDDCVARFGLQPRLRLGRAVESASFDDALGEWRVTLDGGEVLRARSLVVACGQLNRPHIPALPGLDGFAGARFHSAAWDHNCDLTGKRVAVVGTGASAIQFVPEIVGRVAALDVYQRSAPWIMPKEDRLFSEGEKRRFARAPWLERAYRASIYWKNESRALVLATPSARFLLALAERQARGFIERELQDPDKRRKAMPDYRILCKRVLISNDWYAALARPHVDVVTDAIAAVEPRAITTRDERRRPTDVIIFGTGFRATEFLAPMRIAGRGGALLSEAWRDGAEAYKGISVSGFPNLFLLYGPNTNLAHNSILFMLESQIAYVLDGLRQLARAPRRSMDVRADVQARFNADVQRRLATSVWATGCTSWYLTASGKNTNNWPDYTVRYRLLTRKVTPADYEWREAGAAVAREREATV